METKAPQSKKAGVARCAQFIRENFKVMPSIGSVATYSLFFPGGTFTDPEIIKAALSQVQPNELYRG